MECLITDKEMGEYLRASKMKLWQMRKEGMPYLRVGDSVRYELAVVMDWIKGKEVSCHDKADG